MRKQHGDTLIEVMIALAIIGSVIAISYATASRALRTGQAAQERTEALKLIEGQIETLKATAAAHPDDLFSVLPANPTQPSFCVDSSLTIYNEQLTQAKAEDLQVDNLVTASGPNGVPTGAETYNSHCSLGQSGRYKLSVVRSDAIVSGNTQSTFVVRARWERIGGGRDEIAIYYKLHRGMF